MRRLHHQARERHGAAALDRGIHRAEGSLTMDGRELILVVDDDPRNVRLLDAIYRAAGYEVEKAHSCAEALARIEEHPPDLVLLDVMMPGMSGHDVCRKLKESPRTRMVPVVLVTSLSSTEDKVEGLDL